MFDSIRTRETGENAIDLVNAVLGVCLALALGRLAWQQGDVLCVRHKLGESFLRLFLRGNVASGHL